MKKPIASLSLDLDNKWSYMKTHGDRGWETFPSYLDVVVPRLLEFLKARHLTITFFIVGQDAALDKNRDMLAAIAPAGHEIANHSFRHEPWLHLYSEREVDTELANAEEHIERVTGQRPIGFRGPGFSLSHEVLRTLVRRGYLYDASTFPTFLGPLARAYYFMTTKLNSEQMEQRKLLFGSFREGLRPIRPYKWQVDGQKLLEIPVTTMPIFRVPIHLSYVLYLSMITPALALRYARFAFALCRLTKSPPSILLHPLDFLGSEDAQELSFFPGMKFPRAKKLEVVSDALDLLSGQFTILTVQQHARHISQMSTLQSVDPRFETLCQPNA